MGFVVTLVVGLMQVLNFVVGLLALALILRILLPWFGVPVSHSVMKVLFAVTDPLVKPVRGLLGQASYARFGGTYLELAPLAAMMLLLLAQAVVNWVLWLILVPPLGLLRPWENFGGWMAQVLGLLFQIYSFLLIVRVALSWLSVSMFRHPLAQFVWKVTEPVLGLARRYVRPWNGIDFSPIVAILGLWVVVELLSALFLALF